MRTSDLSGKRQSRLDGTKPRFENLEVNALLFGISIIHLLSLVERILLPSPKERCRNTKSFGFFLMTFGRAGFCSPRSWNTKSNGDPLRP